MHITAPCVVTLTWDLTDAQERALATCTAPTEYLVGGGDLLEPIQQALAGQAAGYETRLQIEPEHAFGEYRPELVCFEARTLFPAGVAEGDQFERLPAGAATTGMPDDVRFTVTELYPEHVVLDGNHPLAGLALRVRLKVHAVRAATADEVEAGEVNPLVLGLAAPRGAALH